MTGVQTCALPICSKEGEVTLAHILVNTQAGKPDYPKAISLLENASEDLENDSAVDAQMLLGLIYANGVGIKADDDKATWYFKRSSAISRTGYSEYWAGMMFLNGEEGFIEKNKQKALHWLNLSCLLMPQAQLSANLQSEKSRYLILPSTD